MTPTAAEIAAFRLGMKFAAFFFEPTSSRSPLPLLVRSALGCELVMGYSDAMPDENIRETIKRATAALAKRQSPPRFGVDDPT